jgi:hypothetical protein
MASRGRHDGEREGDGGIARWLKLADDLGLEREYVTSLHGLLPDTRFAVEAYGICAEDILEAVRHRLRNVLAGVYQRARGQCWPIMISLLVKP